MANLPNLTKIMPQPTSSIGRTDVDSRARTHLANERTLLAWIRTSLNMMAIGLGAAQFLEQRTISGIPIVTIFSAALVLSGVLMTATAGYHYQHSYDRIEAGEFRSSTRMVVMAVTLVSLIGVIGLIVVFMLQS
ncbi:MAG: DUF202 domain-containing protein [Chloroflexota bacterium]|nr:DUF202 domain-containing protein [Chloroflexota bacterium]